MQKAKSGRKKWLVIAVVLGGGAFAYSNFSHGGSAGPGGAAAGGGGAIPVVTRTLGAQKVRVWSQFSGRLSPVDAAEVRPEVTGRITKVLFQDGQMVKAGEPLFVIDPRPYEAAVGKAEADLATARSNAAFAALEAKRAKGMIKSQAIAQRVYDERVNASHVADAAVKAAEAELANARVDVEHAYVRAPITGRAGRVELTVGNPVQAGPNAPLLTTVVANKDIYADFEVDDQTYMNSIRSHADKRDNERKIPVRLTLQGEKEPGYDGTIYSFDNHLDVASGTIRARAKFANKDGALLPGMFVTVSLAGSAEQSAILVPESALGFDQNKKFVFVVGPDNKVEYREITLGDKQGDSRIVLSGLADGDRIVVDGVQHIRPGALVDPKDESDVPPPAADAAKS